MITDSKFPSRGAARSAAEDHVEQLLDHALEATFPASDPVALTMRQDFLPARHPGRGRRADGVSHDGIPPSDSAPPAR
jgi:hypothetical protein